MGEHRGGAQQLLRRTIVRRGGLEGSRGRQRRPGPDSRGAREHPRGAGLSRASLSVSVAPLLRLQGSAFGVGFEVAVDTRELLEEARLRMPPTWRPGRSGNPRRAYRLAHASDGVRVEVEGGRLAHGLSHRGALDVLESDLQLFVAQHSRAFVFRGGGNPPEGSGPPRRIRRRKDDAGAGAPQSRRDVLLGRICAPGRQRPGASVRPGSVGRDGKRRRESPRPCEPRAGADRHVAPRAWGCGPNGILQGGPLEAEGVDTGGGDARAPGEHRPGTRAPRRGHGDPGACRFGYAGISECPGVGGGHGQSPAALGGRGGAEC